MRYFIDTEFIEYPNTIELISIGIVDENDNEFYAVSCEWQINHADDWVKKNVIAQLPDDHFWKTIPEIKRGILGFVGCDDSDQEDPMYFPGEWEEPEFWADWGAYDWVVFCWIFGKMIDLPKGWPMFIRDIQQWRSMLGNPEMPEQPESEEHSALNDARWTKKKWKWLYEYDKKRFQEMAMVLQSY